MKVKNLVLFVFFMNLSFFSFSQEAKENDQYVFTKKIELKYTPVKDQFHSGTCWSFAATSFFESELLRLGKGEFDLSEMFFVHHAYLQKAEKYFRFHGTSNFGPGGQAHDVLNIMKQFGTVKQEEYPGIYPGEEKHDHGEMDAVLEAFLKAVISNKSGKLTPVWSNAYASILDAYMGVLPDNTLLIADKNKKPEYSGTLGLNPDDYVELTSYTHHPFYSSFQLEIPDNWSGELYYNLPIDELMKVINNSLENGYTVCWDGDVSDRGFSHLNAIAIVPEIMPVSSDKSEMAKWEKMSDKEKNELAYNFKELRKEKNVTQDMRQSAFNNFQTTDDHLMHIVGKVVDQTGKEYFITKNSWSDKSNTNGGCLNMSEAFLRLNTTAIMVHKDAIPASIRKHLGI